MSSIPEPHIVGNSEAMKQVFQRINQLAKGILPVLIVGETGTGKELVARAIHYKSPRAKRPFIAVNCAAVPESLLESEFFGSIKGAFTGADKDRPGLLETAHGGTIFLDEIGEMPIALQAKLLRALEESEIRPVGAQQARRVNFRVVAATNLDLSSEIAAGRFRLDLFYRLCGDSIRLPPLRDRLEDLPLLVQAFLDRLNRRHLSSKAITVEVTTALARRPWPGNVRELENEVERLFLRSDEVINDPSLVSRPAVADVELIPIPGRKRRVAPLLQGARLREQLSSFLGAIAPLYSEAQLQADFLRHRCIRIELAKALGRDPFRSLRDALRALVSHAKGDPCVVSLLRLGPASFIEDLLREPTLGPRLRELLSSPLVDPAAATNVAGHGAGTAESGQSVPATQMGVARSRTEGGSLLPPRNRADTPHPQAEAPGPKSHRLVIPTTARTQRSPLESSTVVKDIHVPIDVLKAALPEPLEIIMVRGIQYGSFMQRFMYGADYMARRLGVQLYTLQCTTCDDEILRRMIENAVAKRPHAIVIDHGYGSFLPTLMDKAVALGIAVLIFDTDLENPRVPCIRQDDEAMTSILIQHLASDFPSGVKVAYVNDATDFAPLRRRDEAWRAALHDEPRILQVAHTGTIADPLRVRSDNARLIKEVLTQNSDVRAVVAMWDEFAKAAFDAIVDLAHPSRIYSMDLLDDDIELMTLPNSPWVATSATDASIIGGAAIKGAAILVTTGSVDSPIIVAPSLITSEMLRHQGIKRVDELRGTRPGFLEL